MVRFGISTSPSGVNASFSGKGRVFPIPEWGYEFSRFANLVTDWGPAWDRIVESFQRTMDEQFQSEGRRLSGGWAPLTPLYYFWKEERFPGQPILSLTGALREAATHPRVTKTAKQLQITIVDPKFKWHQYGTSRMVARPIIAYPQDLKMEWAKIFQVHMVNCAKKVFT